MMSTTFGRLLLILGSLLVVACGAADPNQTNHQSTDGCDAGWSAYKDERCVRHLAQAGLQTHAEAVKQCAALSAHLLAIRNADEQAFVARLLFTTEKVEENVWLGATRDAASGVFMWDETAASKMEYANWYSGHPKNANNAGCLQIAPDFEAKWVDEPCTRKGVVVCQRPQSVSIGRLHEMFLEQRKALAASQSEIRHLRETSSKQQAEIGLLRDAAKAPSTYPSIPLGYIYVQLPKEKSPSEIWPAPAVWTEVTAAYAGVFFRAAGGEAAQFGSLQEDAAPRLVKGARKFEDTMVSGAVYNKDSADIGKGETSKWIYTGTGNQGWHEYLQFTVSGGEVRPKNMAMRIWKRTA